MKSATWTAGLVAEAVMYYTMVDPRTVVTSVLGDHHHESYLREKEKKLERSGVFFFLHLDPGNRARFVEAAMKHFATRFDQEDN